MRLWKTCVYIATRAGKAHRAHTLGQTWITLAKILMHDGLPSAHDATNHHKPYCDDDVTVTTCVLRDARVGLLRLPHKLCAFAFPLIQFAGTCHLSVLLFHSRSAKPSYSSTLFQSNYPFFSSTRSIITHQPKFDQTNIPCINLRAQLRSIYTRL